jgi:hypothetical protein
MLKGVNDKNIKNLQWLEHVKEWNKQNTEKSSEITNE